MSIFRSLTVTYFIIIILVILGTFKDPDTKDTPIITFLYFLLPGFYALLICISKKFSLFLSNNSDGIASILGLILLILIVLGAIDAFTLKGDEEISQAMMFILLLYLFFMAIHWFFWLVNGDIDLEKIIRNDKSKKQ